MDLETQKEFAIVIQVTLEHVLVQIFKKNVKGTLKLRLDVVLEADILLNLAIDIFQKLFFNFEFAFQNIFVIVS